MRGYSGIDSIWLYDRDKMVTVSESLEYLKIMAKDRHAAAIWFDDMRRKAEADPVVDANMVRRYHLGYVDETAVYDALCMAIQVIEGCLDDIGDKT